MRSRSHLACLIPALFAIAGCGGGGGIGGPPPATGQVEIRVDWPSRGRYIPTYANSIVAKLVTNTNRTYTLTINRVGSDSYQGTSMFSQAIPVGINTLTVDAFTAPHGGGSKVATATLSISVHEGVVNSVNVTADLTSLIDHIDIQGLPLTVQAGTERQLTAVAKTAQNGTILLPDGALTWTVVAGNQFGSISLGGLFLGISQGVATVRVAEIGAGVWQEADVTVTPPPPPPATYRIVFLSDRDDVGSQGFNAIYSVLSDGNGLTRLTTDQVMFRSPSLNLDGSLITFASDKDVVLSDEIYVMASSGGAMTRLTFNDVFDVDPVFSPNGQKIAFSRLVNGFWQIFTMNSNGTGVVQITSASANHSRPFWSPDGSKIAYESDQGGFFQIWSMNAEGTGKIQLTNTASHNLAPAYKPDGSKIVFVSYRATNGDIYTMNPNGSSQARLLALSGSEDDPTYTSDGLGIVFSRDSGFGSHDIWFVKSDGTGAINITQHPAHDTHPTAIVFP